LAFGIDIRAKLFKKIIDSFGGRLKTVICGGAYLHPDYVKRFNQFGIKVLQGYGITECSPLVAVNRNKYWKYDSVGIAVPCCEVKIAGDEKVGEILIKGDNVMLGYFSDEGRTSDAIEDGWYKSGDIGYIDRRKFIYITGRKANLIVFKNGKNASPEEIESRLTQNDIIKEAIVVARKDKDGVRDLFAYLKVDDELARTHGSPTINDMVTDIIKEINSNQPFYRHIMDFALVNSDFPKTTSKKIIRYKVGGRDDV
jgi:long-chain acyl-CoA synthetase